jgi:hypothetical protein
MHSHIMWYNGHFLEARCFHCMLLDGAFSLESLYTCTSWHNITSQKIATLYFSLVLGCSKINLVNLVKDLHTQVWMNTGKHL